MASAITFIETQKLTGTSNTVVFSNIPQSFTSLRLIGVARVNSQPSTKGPRTHVFLNLGNGKRMLGSFQESNFADNNLRSSGYRLNGINSGSIGLAAISDQRANGFSSIQCDILNYTNKKAGYFSQSTNHQSYTGGNPYQTYDGTFFSGGIILGEVPLTTMTIHPQTPYDFVANTQFWLYGIG